jgi:hypothetical protein
MYPPCCAIGCDLEQWIHGARSTLNGMETRSSGIQIMTLISPLHLPSKRSRFISEVVNEVTLVPESVVEDCPHLRYSKNEMYALNVRKRTKEEETMSRDDFDDWMDANEFDSSSPELQYHNKFDVVWRNPQYVADNFDDDFWGRHAGFFGWICHDCVASTLPKVEAWIDHENQQKEAKAKEEADRKNVEIKLRKAEENRRMVEAQIRKSREDDSASYVKAGIPESIVSLWVEGKLQEKQMLGLLSIFRESLGEWEEILNLAMSKNPNLEIDTAFLNEANKLFELAKTHTLEWIYHFVKHGRDSNDIQFIAEITGNEEFYFLELVLLNEEFPFDEAKNLYQNCGFDDRPDALGEVLNGANWKAVAVKHGFFQL